ncbi:MAG: ORF6N domain-containing protein [Candidatus Paceibacterota bacterium]|jgi:phage regulator Rha-like protein
MQTSAPDTKPISIIPMEVIERRIYLIRGQKVMLDSDLAELYGVSTIRLNEQVRRNLSRFPQDFMFQISKNEYESLRSQIAISNTGRGGRRYLPYAFTEHGVAMLSAVLRSPRAVAVSVYIVRAFIKLREMLATHKDLAKKMEDLENRQENQGKQMIKVFQVLKQLLEEPVLKKEPMGFRRN